MTSYGYGNLGLLISRTDALLHAESRTYDIAGKPAQVTDRKGQVSGLTYDSRNRLAQIGYGASATSPTSFASTVGYTYDAADRATQIADSTGGTITRTYDGLDRLTQEQTPEGTVAYTYDAGGRRSTMTVAGQPTVTYAWDVANRLTSITQGGDVVAFTYDNANRRMSTTLANGVVTSYGYDNADQLTSITYAKGATTIGDLQYSYDAAGRRVTVTGSLATVDLPAAVASATVNANNQLTAWGAATLTYDLNGNLTGDGAKTYVWNARDELASISGAVTASFVYDGVGRRRSKTIGATQTGFVYDQLNFVQELNGASVTANLVTGRIDELFSRKEGTSTSYPVSDALGSVIKLTDATGTMQTQYSFEPYGKATVAGSASNNSQNYTGREDDGAGLMYYRARYFSPTIARFLAEDPVDIEAGPNVYAYVEGDPLSKRDPSGLWSATMGLFPGAGAQLSFGKNPNGSGFASLQFGWGIGGGVSYNPLGQQPGYKECQGASWGLGLGLYGQGSFAAGPIGTSLVTNLGRNFRSTGSEGYGGFLQPNGGGRSRIGGINASASAGGQMTFFGGGSAKGDCTCP